MDFLLFISLSDNYCYVLYIFTEQTDLAFRFLFNWEWEGTLLATELVCTLVSLATYFLEVLHSTEDFELKMVEDWN